jgi:predicted choloylglycine hydrolase
MKKLKLGEKKEGKGRLRLIDGQAKPKSIVHHFSGSSKEIGKQYGEYLSEMKIQTSDSDPHFDQKLFDKQLAIYKKFYPAYLEEMEGLAEF